MEWLLASEPRPVLGAAVGTVAGLLLVSALALRHRIDSNRGTVQGVLMADTSSVLRVLGVTFAVLAVGLAFGVEGLGSPLWLALALFVALATGGLLARRWRGVAPARGGRQRRLNPIGAPDRTIASTAWEVGILVGGGAGLLTYLATVDHLFGHPPHWIIAVIGALLGYAAGIAAVTPRFRLQSAPRNS